MITTRVLVRGIGDVGTKRWRLHGRSRNGLSSTVLWLLGILMTAKRLPANIRDAEPRGHPTTIPTTQTVTAQMHSQEEVVSDFISAG